LADELQKMKIFKITRPTIYDVPTDLPMEAYKARIPDAAMRRHLSWGMDFDSRALSFAKIEDHWDPEVKSNHRANQERTKLGLIAQFGERAIDTKIENFIDIDTKPMSVLAYHNDFFEQVRNAFVMGQYYPALVGACALGERILNHLILDMRPFFEATPEYRRVHRKDSFDNWDVQINTLEVWSILLPEAVKEFRALKRLRHRSIHFNVSTYSTLRDDALAAILHMRAIIEQQFGSFALRPWFITGTRGHVFIRKSFETHPFVIKYFIPRCPFVGPLFGLALTETGEWEVFDMPDYGDENWSDEEFAHRYNERDPSQVLSERPTFNREPNESSPVSSTN
jgi:hypothetical protein